MQKGKKSLISFYFERIKFLRSKKEALNNDIQGF